MDHLVRLLSVFDVSHIIAWLGASWLCDFSHNCPTLLNCETPWQVVPKTLLGSWANRSVTLCVKWGSGSEAYVASSDGAVCFSILLWKMKNILTIRIFKWNRFYSIWSYFNLVKLSDQWPSVEDTVILQFWVHCISSSQQSPVVSHFYMHNKIFIGCWSSITVFFFAV